MTAGEAAALALETASADPSLMRVGSIAMTTASAIARRVPPFATERHFRPSISAGAACGHGTRARAFATCHLAGASTLCPSRRR